MNEEALCNLISFELIQTSVVDALKRLYTCERDLFEFENYRSMISERCLVFQFGWHLNQIFTKNPVFRGYKVDCEYNRNFAHPKGKYNEVLKKVETIKTPDLIVHKRKSNSNNVLVMEVKKVEKDDDDIERLKFYTSKDEVFKYQYGVHIVLQKEKASISYVIDGKEMADKYQEIEFRK